MLAQEKNNRGFAVIAKINDITGSKKEVVKESSAIGEYKDSFECAGSSYIWVSEQQLNRKEVKRLIKHLKNWIKNKTLFINTGE